jgi:hypothetical protein
MVSSAHLSNGYSFPAAIPGRGRVTGIAGQPARREGAVITRLTGSRRGDRLARRATRKSTSVPDSQTCAARKANRTISQIAQ